MVQWEVPPTRRIAFVTVLLVVAASVVVTVAASDYRLGGYTLAGAVLLAAGMRATMPERYCLGLLVRSRQLDVLLDAGLGVAVLVAAHVLP